MFCTNCGSKLQPPAGFCSNCGTKAGLPAASSASNLNSPIIIRGIIIAAVVVVAAALLFFAVSRIGIPASCGGVGLSGTWELMWGESSVYTFSGRNYTLRDYRLRPTGELACHRAFNMTEETYLSGDFREGEWRELRRVDNDTFVWIERGTFSISGDQIEFVPRGGTIRVTYFSRTENTIAIGHPNLRFVRR